MEKDITVGSLFDGIGGWLLAAKRAGLRPLWSSEIDPFPASISHSHFPKVDQLGDITKIERLPFADIICAGSPCQDLSVAGKREGLKGERSGLFLCSTRLVWRMREMEGKENFPSPQAAMEWWLSDRKKKKKNLQWQTCSGSWAMNP